MAPSLQYCAMILVRVNCKMCVCSCHIRIRMCVMSDLGGINDYAVTATVNPSDRLGGMNTCDHHRARNHVRKPGNIHTHAQPEKSCSSYTHFS